MRYMFNVALFDLDGTLFDTLPDIHSALEYALIQNGINQPLSIDETREFIGDGLKAFLEKAVFTIAGLTKCPEQIISQYITYYSNHCTDKTMPYPGISDLLENLKYHGIKMAVVSNKSEIFVKKILSFYGFDKYFINAFGGDSFPSKKPSPEPIIRTVKALSSNISLDNIIMIGDSENDICSGVSAGVKTCWCTYGYGSPITCKPDFTAVTPDEIKEFFI